MAKKQLNLSNLKKLDSQLNVAKEVILSNGYSIQIDTKFRQTRIETVFNKLLELQKIIQEDESLKDFDFQKYSMLLLILNFTSLRNMELKNVSEEIQVMNMLIDQNLFKEIIKKMEEHCGEEIKKFNSSIVNIMQEKLESLKAQEQFMSILNDEMEKIKVEQNEDIINDEVVDEVEVIKEGDENSFVGEPTKENREEITTEN